MSQSISSKFLNAKRRSWLLLILVILLTGIVWAYARTVSLKPTEWRTLAPGLSYTRISLPTGQLHAFKIELKDYQLKILMSGENGSAKIMGEQAQSLITSNGGFFTPSGQSLGLRISQGKTLSPLKNISWWGIFYIQNNIPHLSSLKDFQNQDNIEFAIQAGPRLLIDKAIPKLKEDQANRTAIGYTAKGEILLISTENAALSTEDLAKILRRSEKSGGLGCISALNLDGGSSSQLYAKVGDFQLDVPNYRYISDGLGVFQKN